MPPPAGPGLTTISPEPSEASPLIVVPASRPAGTVTGVHVDPPSVLSQVAAAPLPSVPEITVSWPAAAA